MNWKPIAELTDRYAGNLLLSSPEIVDGDTNIGGIALGYYQDDEGWIISGYDMSNGEFCNQTLTTEDNLMFCQVNGPFYYQENNIGR